MPCPQLIPERAKAADPAVQTRKGPLDPGPRGLNAECEKDHGSEAASLEVSWGPGEARETLPPTADFHRARKLPVCRVPAVPDLQPPR